MNQSPVVLDMDASDKKNAQENSAQTLGKSTISVHSCGEVNCTPDIIQFTVSIRSSKESVEEAQASIKRRTDYVSQVIRKNGIKNNDFAISTELSRKSIEETECVTVQADVVVKCDNLSRCENTRNVLMEKMDSSVHFSSVNFWHSTEAKESGRQEAFKRAVASAKAKAECISLTVGVQLGSAIEVKEIALDSFQGRQGLKQDSGTEQLSLHQRHINASLNFTSQVFICFEAIPIRNCNHRKCPKH